MGKLKDLKEQFFTDFKDEFPENDLKSMFELLVDKYLNIPEEPNQQEEFFLKDFQQQELEMALSRLKKNEPIQYILGKPVSLVGSLK